MFAWELVWEWVHYPDTQSQFDGQYEHNEGSEVDPVLACKIYMDMPTRMVRIYDIQREATYVPHEITYSMYNMRPYMYKMRLHIYNMSYLCTI